MAAMLAALSAGCGGGDGDAGEHGDAAVIDPDAGPGGPLAGRDSGPLPCTGTADCPPGQECLGSICQDDPCATDSPCAAGERCVASCVDLVDPCAGIVCGVEETCIGGVCFPGCLPVACEGKTCAPGSFCDPSTGECAPIAACDASCGGGEACHFTCVPRSACEGVTCAEGEFCRAGECLSNPCFGVDCAPGEVCQNGECVETCNCDPGCEAPERCIANRCVCVPTCGPDATCGTPDGCGGFCVSDCPSSGDECNPDTGLCECVPSCPADAACGADDGCGGRCDGPCADGRSCVDGACACLSTCLEASVVSCGDAIPPPCMGGMTCSGTGTRCEAGAECIDGSCCPGCARRTTVACGAPVPDSVDATGAVCRDCTEHGTMCPSGEGCVLPPGATADSERVCCGLCAPPSSIPCGVEIPDVLDAMGNVCRECTGTGTGGCATGESCAGGAMPMCCEDCATADAVACGAAIPDPSCRTCPGFGRMCDDPTESCVLPPGATADASRRCCESCPGRSTVACGEAVPDVLASDGTLCRDCGTGTACSSGSTCADGACCPACPDPSSFACGTPIPDAVDSLGRVCRSCGTGTGCAALGTCTDGLCCPSCADRRTLACGVDPVEPPGCPACPTGTACAAGEACRDGACCALGCAPPSTRPCGTTPTDGCGGTCAPGTACPGVGEVCVGDPPACVCEPSCAGRRCGESDGCGGECMGRCDAGFVCSEQPPPAAAGDYECEPSECRPACGLCESCIFGACEPLACAPGETACLATCECCPAGSSCTPMGCRGFI